MKRLRTKTPSASAQEPLASKEVIESVRDLRDDLTSALRNLENTIRETETLLVTHPVRQQG